MTIASNIAMIAISNKVSSCALLLTVNELYTNEQTQINWELPVPAEAWAGRPGPVTHSAPDAASLRYRHWSGGPVEHSHDGYIRVVPIRYTLKT